MKRRMALVLALLLAVSGTAALAQSADMTVTDDGMTQISRPERVIDEIGLQRGTEITVGSTTPISGMFGTNLMMGTTSDMDVRDLLEGYMTIAMTRTQEMVFDGTAIENVSTTQEWNGDRIYTIQITDGLTYNDGSPITSKDYLFTVLLSTSPLLPEINMTQRGFEQIVGVPGYRAGDTQVVQGLRYISDSEFSVRISGEYLPYFYGMEMLNITPYPYSVIAPGCDVLDYGEGVFIGVAESGATQDATDLPYTPGVFSADMLRETLLNTQTGYVYNPKVTAGPYSLESFNPVTNHATFVVNELYRGNYEGQRPHIERIHFRLVRNDTMMNLLRDGEINLINKVSNLVPLTEGMKLSDEERLVNRDVYPRSGLAYLSFACEQGPTANESVRNAIARAIDRESLVDSILGDVNGVPVYGYYGIGQWMVNSSFAADPARGLQALNVQDAVDGLKFEYSLQAAKNFLIEGGWTLNANGGAFQEGVDEVRYMNVQGRLYPLMINWAIPMESQVARSLRDALTEVFPQLGIGLTVTEMPLSDMLQYYFREKERTYDMFFIASNFGSVFDPYFDFHTGDEYQGQLNVTGLRDERLMDLALKMRTTNPSEPRQYVENWIQFQYRFVELMPVAPLYSNVYFDFYPIDLQDYNIAQHPSWAPALMYAWFGDRPAPVGGDETEQFIDFSDQAPIG